MSFSKNNSSSLSPAAQAIPLGFSKSANPITFTTKAHQKKKRKKKEGSSGQRLRLEIREGLPSDT
jgi:hypothetical protein